MSTVAIALALCAVVAAPLPWPGMFLGIGLGIAAIGVGVVAYRRREHPGGRRLTGATAIAIGALGFAFGATRYVLSLLAIDKLETLLRG